MITEIFEHSVDLDLLPERANILDVGCLGMDFTDYFRVRGHNVHAVDIQEFDGDYERLAITVYNGETSIVRTADPQATHIANDLNGKETVQCFTLERYTELTIGAENIWDLIKFDCEGAECGIIMSLTKAPAKQISCEFHLHTGAYSDIAMLMIEDKLHELGYTAMQHKLSDRHCAGSNFWDSLFILK